MTTIIFRPLSWGKSIAICTALTMILCPADFPTPYLRRPHRNAYHLTVRRVPTIFPTPSAGILSLQWYLGTDIPPVYRLSNPSCLSRPLNGLLLYNNTSSPRTRRGICMLTDPLYREESRTAAMNAIMGGATFPTPGVGQPLSNATTTYEHSSSIVLSDPTF